MPLQPEGCAVNGVSLIDLGFIYGHGPQDVSHIVNFRSLEVASQSSEVDASFHSTIVLVEYFVS